VAWAIWDEKTTVNQRGKAAGRIGPGDAADSAALSGEGNDVASLATIAGDADGPRQRVLRWLRPLVGLALLAFLLWRVNWLELGQIARQARLGYIALAVCIALLTVLPRVWRWRALLVSQGTTESFRHLLTIYLVSNFFNNFLPSDVGGDSVRMLRLARRTGRSADAVTSVLVERMIGLFAVLLLGVVAVLSNWQLASVGGIGWLVLGAFAVFILISLLLFNLQGALSWVERLGVTKLAIVLRKLGRVYDSFYAFRDRRHTLVLVLAFSLLFRFGQACSLYVQSLALRIDIPFVWLLMVISLISVVTSLPLSLNALGIQEGAYVFFFGLAGIPAPQALALALLSRAVRLAVSLVGGATYLLGK
jgi:hypothetical protein